MRGASRVAGMFPAGTWRGPEIGVFDDFPDIQDGQQGPMCETENEKR